MAFFEQLGYRIAEARHGVVKQTRNLTDTTRLNAKIADNKREMSQLLFELGQNYYQKHRKETDNEEQPYIDRVNELFQEILSWQDEIERIKSGEVGRVCGSRIVEGAAFCISCGTRLDMSEVGGPARIEVGQTRCCPVCGTMADEDSVF